MAKLGLPPQPTGRLARLSQALDRASERVEPRLVKVLDTANARGAERSRNLESISDPALRRSAAKK